MLRNSTIALLAACLCAGALGTAMAADTVQVDVKSILNGRSVTTLTAGKLVTWESGYGIDMGGTGDGYLTLAASLFKGDVNPHALPDSGIILPDATKKLPKIVLNYTNADDTSKQTKNVKGIGSFNFNVQNRKYSKMFIFLTSSEGTANITVTCKYAADSVVKSYVVPDYAWDIAATDTNFCYVLHNLAKWGSNNNMTEAGSHNIDALNIHADSNKTLLSVNVSKTTDVGYMVFWGATGIANSLGTVAVSAPIASNSADGLCSVRACAIGKNTVRFSHLPTKSALSVFSVSGALLAQVNTSESSYTLDLKKRAAGAIVCKLQNGRAGKIIVVPATR